MMNGITLDMGWSLAAWLGMAIKGGLVLATAGLLAVALHRASAALRHLVWTLALVSLPVLTLLSLAGPGWKWPVLKVAAPAPGPHAVAVMATPAGPVGHETLALEAPTPIAMTQGDVAPFGPPAQAGAPYAEKETVSAFPLVKWLLGIWVVAAGIICLPLGFGLLTLFRVRRTARIPDDDYWAAALEQARRDLPLRRSVVLLEHDRQTMPMTWGTLRPTVMLPAEARTWTEQKQRAVLLHELAHVRRYDYLTRILARIGLALHVFNPLAWLAWRHMRTESERACDDRVLSAGADPADYADQLIQIAQHCIASQWSAASAITMARKSQLEGRILAVLDAARSRAAINRARVLGYLLLTAMVVIPVSVVRLVAADTPMRHFVRVVVGEDSLTFEGETVDLSQLGQRMAEVPDRPNTVIELAYATEEISLREWNEAKHHVSALSHDHGFEYLSEVGLHPLESGGSKSEPRTPTEAYLAEQRDLVKQGGELLPALQHEMDRVMLRAEQGHAYKDKVDLAGVWEDFRQHNQPEADEIRRLMEAVEQWGATSDENPEYPWRVAHVLAAMARDAGDAPGAIAWMDKALQAYPEVLYREPSKHSKFQHLVNDRAAFRWEQEGPDKAFPEAYDLFMNDPRFEYFFLSWWENQAREQVTEDDIEELKRYILAGYAERLERFPGRASVTLKYLQRLAEETDEDHIPSNVRALLEKPEVPSAGPLQTLIDQAEPGDTVEIPAGTHDEPLRIDKAVTLRGTSRSQAMLKVKSDRPAIHVLTDEPVSVENLTIEWQRASSERTDHPQAAVAAKDGPLSIVNCEFSGDAGIERCPAALLVDGFAELELRDCLFSGFNFTVQVTGGAKGVVEDCVFVNSGHCGLTALKGAELTVRRNLFTGSAYHGLRCTGGTLHAEDNLIIANRNRGIYVGNRAAHGSIRNNLILGNASGISVFGGSDTEIRNNVILDNTFVGIDARSFCPIKVEGNILAGNDQGFIVWKEGNAPAVVNLSANTFWENTSNDVANMDLPVDTVLADPGFADATAGDYSRPGASGPGADHGLTDPAALKPVWEKWEAVRKLVGRR